MRVPIKDFRVIAKIKNNQLIERREQLGLSAPQVAEEIGLSYGTYIQYESIKQSPYRSHSDEIKESAQKIADFYGESVCTIWPNEVLSVKKTEVVKMVNVDDARNILGAHSEKLLTSTPHSIIEDAQMSEQIHDIVKALTPRESQVISLLYGLGGHAEKTTREVATYIGVSTTRIDQIKQKALRKLRCTSRSRQLKELVHDDHVTLPQRHSGCNGAWIMIDERYFRCDRCKLLGVKDESYVVEIKQYPRKN